MQLAPPRGTRDFYPDEMRLRNWIFSVWRETARCCGFEEYDSSILEHEELYVIKSGPEILGQLYNFEDKGARRVALRPEMTPSLARMIAARGSALPKPIKWFSIVQCFRYERMSRGRKREHYQLNLDVVGVPDVTAEAELLAAALSALSRMGFRDTDVAVRISHRGLLGAVLTGFEIPEEGHAGVFAIIDKRGKEADDNLSRQMEGLGIDPAKVRQLFGLLDDPRVETFSRFLNEHDLDATSLEDLRSLFTMMEAYGLHKYCEFAPSIVRGLPYYTGIVFECFDRRGEYRAIFGGGRYDRLMGLFQAGDLPAAGLGFGDVVIQENLARTGRTPDLTRRLDYFLIPFSEQERLQALDLLHRIRTLGGAADILLTPRKLKAALREASRVNARTALLLLPDELREGVLVLRNLEDGTEQRVEKASLIQAGFFLPSAGGGTLA